ncbi:FAD-dependent oxidoreductase [Streptomyces sp. NPDC006552]|uniref:NAD(P)/FAD-dependent oxidoreductase n=1 Tax=Streptomyces sp. NPDC006552 TaxID=3157179 RepID=UPI0033BF7B18
MIPAADPPVIVVGGGVAGPATALALARRGVRVRLLERSGPPPDGPAAKAAQLWERPAMPQRGHSHVLNSLGVRVLRQEAPDLLASALEEGARLLDLTEAAPGAAAGGGAADPELVTLAVRRSLLDLLLHRALAAQPGVVVEYGTTVRGLWLDPSGSRVRGVWTGRGERMAARSVVDATGRGAASRAWLSAAGAPPAADLSDPVRLRCFTRFYRLTDPDGPLPGPLNRGNAAGAVWDHYAAVAHPADNGVFALSLGTLTGDTATRALSAPAAFTAAARLTPHLSAWTRPGVATPLTDVRVIAAPANTLRGTVRPGAPQVAGVFPVGDAACVTDPLYGRGLSLALQHAFRLADLLAGHPAADAAQAEQAAQLADGIMRPWYEQAVYDSRARTLLWQARANGTAPAAPRPAAPGRPDLARIGHAAAGDATVWRGLTRVLMGLDTPAQVFDSPAFRDRVTAAGPATAPAGRRPPTRQDLLAALTAAGEG